ncbi:hypothetical protein J1TS5_25940 [Paenibacillus macerans]|uniref:hypothetical protein n=1 Tax=Paenibacillus macerans TaxID=44252 RepID=UPI001B281057|nr:hypothetical protein [Paenibacillus macerans]GIP10424.1 hypothetical protein J1TS5_25940 [Paenibacillus macerans]
MDDLTIQNIAADMTQRIMQEGGRVKNYFKYRFGYDVEALIMLVLLGLPLWTLLLGLWIGIRFF